MMGRTRLTAKQIKKITDTCLHRYTPNLPTVSRIVAKFRKLKDAKGKEPGSKRKKKLYHYGPRVLTTVSIQEKILMLRKSGSKEKSQLHVILHVHACKEFG